MIRSPSISAIEELHDLRDGNNGNFDSMSSLGKVAGGAVVGGNLVVVVGGVVDASVVLIASVVVEVELIFGLSTKSRNFEISETDIMSFRAQQT
jgi:hypothetical protein